MFTKTSFSCVGAAICERIHEAIRNYVHRGFVGYPDTESEPYASAKRQNEFVKCMRNNQRTLDFYGKYIVAFVCKCGPSGKPVIRHNVRSAPRLTWSTEHIFTNN